MSSISPDDLAPPSRPMLPVGCLFMVTGLLAWAALSHSKSGTAPGVMPGDPGPYFLAHLSIAAILVAGVVLCVAGVRKGGAVLALPDLRQWRQPALYVATLLGMPLAMSQLGTPAAVALFALLWIIALVRDAGRSWPVAVATGVLGAGAASGFTYVVFIRLLTLPLPV